MNLKKLGCTAFLIFSISQSPYCLFRLERPLREHCRRRCCQWYALATAKGQSSAERLLRGLGTDQSISHAQEDPRQLCRPS